MSSRSRLMRHVAILFLAVAASNVALSQVRSGVDLVIIDATVVQRDGTPLPDLQADDFTVKVDGKVRRMLSVQFVRFGASPAPASEAVPRVDTPPRSTLEQDSSARLVVIVFDSGNIRAGIGRDAIQSVAPFLDRLHPADQVALLTIPPPGPGVEFTTDHARVRSALGLMAGSVNSSATRFNIGLSEAREIARGSREALTKVRLRECRGERPGGGCDAIVEAEARRIWGEAQERARASLNGLHLLLRHLEQVTGPKTILLFTEGLAADRFTPELRNVALNAGRARATLYVLHLDTPLYESASGMRAPISAFEDSDITNDGVRTLATATRGAYLRVIASPANALARIEREMSGYYLIGIEASTQDRDGKPHRIEVRVGRRELTVRHRREFVIHSPKD